MPLVCYVKINYFLLITVILILRTDSGALSIFEQKKYKTLTDGHDLYSSKDDVEILTATNFKDEIYNSERAWLVEFYNSWCGFCQRFAPSWKALATDVKNWRDLVGIGAIDCSNDDNYSICREFEIMGFPTVRYFHEKFQEGPKNFGLKIKPGSDLKEHREKLLQAIINEEKESERTIFPSLMPYDSHDLLNVFKSLSKEVEYIFLLIQEPTDFVAQEITMDLHKIKYFVIRYAFNNNTQLINVLDVSKTPILLSIDRKYNYQIISVDSPTREAYRIAISQFLKPKHVDVESQNEDKNIFRGKWKDFNIPSFMHEREREALKERFREMGDVVLPMDLETTLRYSLKHEVPGTKEISGEKLVPLRSYLDVTMRKLYSKQNKQLRGGIIMFLITKWTEPEVRQYTSGNIVAGAGYSSDSQQVVPQVCYNATVSSTSAQQGYVQLDTALSSSALENKLGVSVSISGKYGMFSADAQASYIRSVQDKDYSLSLNYYEYATNNVAVQLVGYGEKALTESGKDFYNGGKNKYFGLLCGDHYITSYQQGALLTMGLNIKFSSSNAKKEFEEKAGATFGDIVRAAESIKSVVTEYKITGSVIIQAFQMGGEPSQLAKILNKDSTGQYYALACSLTAMDQCIKAASGLLDYAKDNFSTQFSFQNNTGLTPLGIAFSQYTPIEYIGLTPPISLVTPEVVQYRDELASRLKENEYYQQKFYPFFNKGYPVELHANFINNANLILSKANSNVAVLMQSHGGACDCFNFPDKCKNIKAGIDSQLQNITISDLKFLEAVKYTITTAGGMFYNTGSGKAWGAPQWSAVPNNKPGKEMMLVKVKNFFITDERYSYDTDVQWPVTPDLYEMYYEGNFNSSWMKYVGTMCFKLESSANWIQPCQRGYPEAKLISPFFFEALNITEWCH